MIWIVVCDGSIAKVFEKQHRFSPLMHLESFTHTHESTHEHGKDRPGRSFESASPHRHAYEPKSNWHDRQKILFIEQILTCLLKALENKKFSTLYFICPPKLVSIFREDFEKRLDVQHKNQLSIKEIHKDLIHCTSSEIDKIILKEEGWQ